VGQLAEETTMPKSQAIDAELRRRIGDGIGMGLGRNELARRHGVSPGLVSKIARERGLWFENCTMTATATQAQQIDQWAKRADREDELLHKYLALDNTDSRKARKLSYALYNVSRHHNGQYR
jgi:hypothetical protein